MSFTRKCQKCTSKSNNWNIKINSDLNISSILTKIKLTKGNIEFTLVLTLALGCDWAALLVAVWELQCRWSQPVPWPWPARALVQALLWLLQSGTALPRPLFAGGVFAAGSGTIALMGAGAGSFLPELRNSSLEEEEEVVELSTTEYEAIARSSRRVGFRSQNMFSYKQTNEWGWDCNLNLIIMSEGEIRSNHWL